MGSCPEQLCVTMPRGFDEGVYNNGPRVGSLTRFRCVGSLEESMETHSSIVAWRIAWTEEPGGLQFMGSHKRLNAHRACMPLIR